MVYHNSNKKRWFLRRNNVDTSQTTVGASGAVHDIDQLETLYQQLLF